MKTKRDKTVKEMLAMDYPNKFTFMDEYDNTIYTATFDKSIDRYVLTYTKEGEERTAKGYYTDEVKLMVDRGTFLKSLV